jgi:hypothetical protein
VIAHPDNAAVQLVEDGVKAVIAPSREPEVRAEAAACVRDAGPALRDWTAAWFVRKARRLSLDGSLERVLQTYRQGMRPALA